MCSGLSDLMNCIRTKIREINIPNLHLPGSNMEIGGHRPQLALVQSLYRRVRGRDCGREISSAKPTIVTHPNLDERIGDFASFETGDVARLPASDNPGTASRGSHREFIQH
jgi:hypothetical protein